jgi:hypothetical protein
MTRGTMAALMIVSATGLAFATDVKSQYGGRAAEAGEYHVELVTKADVIDLYLADHNNKGVAAAGHKGLAILIINGKSQRIVLAPAGESRLTGRATGDMQGAPKGVVQITLPNGKSVQARF